ncbi:MAG: OmpH family outer membrane protein [Kiritimatiellae bacterium]|nr:OmpH family outer membrane protein [Kiritimatiellia bacterium]
MKKVVFAAVMAVAAAASADMKFGVVDMMVLIKNHPNYDSNKELLTSTDKDYQKKLDAIKGEGESLQEEGKKLAEQLRNPMLAAKAKADVEKQLMAIQQKLIGIEQRYRSEAVRCRQDLQDLESRLLKTTTEDLRKRIAKFAEDKGYDFVFDRTAAPFAKPEYDVTDDILSSMNVDPKSARGRDEGK